MIQAAVLVSAESYRNLYRESSASLSSAPCYILAFEVQLSVGPVSILTVPVLAQMLVSQSRWLLTSNLFYELDLLQIPLLAILADSIGIPRLLAVAAHPQFVKALGTAPQGPVL